MSVERARKHRLANGLRLLTGLVGKAVALPGRAVALDQKRAHRRRVAIVMRVERTQFGLDKRLRQRIEPLAGAEPCELVAGTGDRGAEIALERAAHQRVET